MMIPERIALRMIDDKWILRSKIVWAKQIYDQKENRTKGSVMPTSVKDRFNTSWEYLFHFVKNKKYFFDLDAVRLPIQTIENRNMGIDREKEYPDAKRNKFAFNYRVRDAKKKEGNPQFKASEKEIRNYTREREIRRERGISGTSITPTGKDHNLMNNPNGKNLPNVWLIGTEPSKELHFARFPTSLCEIPIMATCPEKICKVCGKIREKITEQVDARIQKPRKFNKAGNSDRNDTGRVYVEKDTKVIGYTSCGHNDYEPGIVLDPFCGSGTALKVAQRLGRNYLGIELNKDYIKISEDKLKQKTLR